MINETTVHGKPLERWTISIPRQGPQGKEPIQGTPVYFFHLEDAGSDQLEETLRRVNPSTARRGVPLLYRGDRLIGPDRADQEEERQLAAAHTNAQSPAEAAEAYEVINLRDLRKQLVLELEQKRRELESLQRQIEFQQGRLAAETQRQDEAIARAAQHYQKLNADAQTHYETQLRAHWKTEADLKIHNTEGLRGFGDEIEIVTTARAQINRVMKGTTAVEWLSGFKDTVEGALNSPVGQAVGLGVASRAAAMVNELFRARGTLGPDGKPIPPMDKDDVLAAFVLKGHEFKVRQQALRELRGHVLTRECEAAQLGADFVSGLVELRALVEFVQRRPA